MKKLLSLIVAAVMVFAVLPLGALAAPAAVEQLEKAPTASRGRNSLYLWNFETGPEADGWQFIDADGDGYNWQQSDASYHNGAHSIMSESHHSGTALTPDNWAVSPEIELPEGEVLLKFWLRNANNNYQEKFTVYVGTSDDIGAMEPVTEQITVSASAWYTMNVDLSAYAGQSVFIAFRHNGTTNIFKFYMDDVEVIEIPDTLIFGSCFEQSPLLDGWTYVDADGDGAAWGWYSTAGFAYEGSRFLSSASTGKTPDNWAIVGPIWLRDFNNELSFYARGLGNVTPDETFAVYIGESNDIESMTELIPATVTAYTYTQYTADLDEYANEEVYIAVRHFNSDNKYYLAIDQFEVFGSYNQYVPVIEINDLTIPAWGETPDFEVTAGSDAYTVELVRWFDESGEIEPSFIFEDEANEFYASFEVSANPGYTFSPNTRVLINGSEELVNFYANECADNGSAFHTESVPFTVEREIVTEAEIEGFTAPVNGETPFYAVTAPEGANYSIGETNWYCGDDPVEPGTPFVYGNTYYMEIELIPNYGYKFGDELTASVNGDEALVDEAVVDSPESAWVFTVEVEVEEAEIHFVELFDIELPEADALADFEVSVPDDANYSVSAVSWSYMRSVNLEGPNPVLTLVPGNSFDYGCTYWLHVELAPNEGYKFAEDVTAAINGDANLVDGYTYQNPFELHVFSVPYAIGEAIFSAGVENLVEPVWGDEQYFDATAPEGANYTVDGMFWYYSDGEDYYPMEEGQLFNNTEYEYFLAVGLLPDDGYYFVAPLAYTVNGEEYEPVFEDDGVTYAIYFIGPFTVEREPIEDIAIENFVEPVWGDAQYFDITIPEGVNYGILEAAWCYFDGLELHWLEEGELLDNEEVEYFLGVAIAPLYGYKLAENPSVTVNGENNNYILGGEVDGALLVYIGPFTVTEPDAPETLWGDANGDGTVDTADALLLMRHLIGTDTVEDENLELCDVNGDGSIDLVDALLIMRKAMGTIECFPVEE